MENAAARERPAETERPPAAAASLPRRIIGRTVDAVRLLVEVGLALALGVGLALHLTVRDSLPDLAVLFYALPAPVLATIAFAGFAVSWGRPFWTVLLVGVGLWAAGMTVSVNGWPTESLTSGSAPPDPDDSAAPRPLRLLCWNTFLDVWAGEDAVGTSEVVAATQPDLFAVIEAGLGHDEPSYSADGWRDRVPGYEPIWLRNRFMALTADRITEGFADADAARLRNLTRQPDLDLPPDSYHRIVTFDWRAEPAEPDDAGWRTVTLIMMHPRSDPRWDRGPTMAALTREVERLAADGPLIVCGDFNLPSDSALHDRLRQTMRSAAEIAPGIRYRPTWPCPLPVLELDQVWVSKHFEVHRFASPATWASDHQPLVVELSLTTR